MWPRRLFEVATRASSSCASRSKSYPNGANALTRAAGHENPLSSSTSGPRRRPARALAQAVRMVAKAGRRGFHGARIRIDTFGACFPKDRSQRNTRLHTETAFLPFPPVHRADPERQQGVDLTRSRTRSANGRYLRKAAIAGRDGSGCSFKSGCDIRGAAHLFEPSYRRASSPERMGCPRGSRLHRDSKHGRVKSDRTGRGNCRRVHLQ